MPGWLASPGTIDDNVARFRLLRVANISDNCPVALRFVSKWQHSNIRRAQVIPVKMMILVDAGSPDRIKRLIGQAQPNMNESKIVIAGYGDVGNKLVEMLNDADGD